jgi:hypothetical protein
VAALTGPCFVDTSILVGGVVDIGPATAPAQAIMARIASRKLDRPSTAWHCCLEFYSVLTRLPKELRVSPGVARRLLEEEILERFTVGDLPPEHRGGFLDALVSEEIVGGRVYDAHIAEVARSLGATVVVTDNRRHFTGLLRHGIRVVTGAELAVELDA